MLFLVIIMHDDVHFTSLGEQTDRQMDEQLSINENNNNTYSAYKSLKV